MAKYFPVSPGIWNKRLLGLGRQTALIYCYLLTNPHRNSEGLFRLPLAYAAADLDVPTTEILDSLKALEAEGFIKFDPEAEVVLDLNALFLLAPTSDTQIKGAITKMRQVPRTFLLEELYRLAFAHAPRLAEALEEAFPLLRDTIGTVSQHSDIDLPKDSYRGRQLGGEVDSRSGSWDLGSDSASERVAVLKRALNAEEVG